jgi:D-glycero-D-manno-heptose 1,7-bisphosphate phosphatase
MGIDEVKRAVFLDRDGVITEAIVRDGKPYPSTTILPDAPRALADLKQAGFTLVVVTNQPDVARGTTPRTELDAFHAQLRAELPLDAVYACFHDDADHCACRKPAPGLLRDAARDLGIDLTASFMVGDRWRDIEAGIAAGCRTIFIDREYAERRPQTFDARVTSLPEAATWILEVSK